SKPESPVAQAYRAIAGHLRAQLDAAHRTVLRPFIWHWDTDEGAPGWHEWAIGDSTAKTTPVGFTKRDPRTLSVLWQDGRRDAVDVRALRLACPCAMGVEEMSGRKTLDPNSVRKDVSPRTLSSIGNYAIGVTWNDGTLPGSTRSTACASWVSAAERKPPI